MVIDMTEGKPSTILWKFSMPLLFSVIFQQLYSMVDSIVAGKYCGVNALAAVGASFPITAIFIAIATGFSAGSSVVISQFFGAKKWSDMKCAIWTSMITVLVLSVVLTIVGSVGCNSMMRMLNTPGDVFADSALYLRVYIWGLIFLFFYNICNGVFTALGDSKTPLYFLIASSLGNIVTDILFVAKFHMGVAGVAWATFLCQGIAAVLATITLVVRLTKMQEHVAFQKFTWEMLGKISQVAIPTILQSSFISVGNLIIQRLINGYGAIVIAAYSSAIKLNTFVLVCFSTFSNGLSSFAAQNMGAKKIDRIKEGYRFTIKIGIGIGLFVTVLFLLGGNQLLNLFLPKATDVSAVLKEGNLFLRIISPFYAVVASKIITDGVLKGTGAMKHFMIATFSDLIIRVVLSYLFALTLSLGSLGIWLSWPVGWIIGTLLSIIFYRSGKWQEVKVV